MRSPDAQLAPLLILAGLALATLWGGLFLQLDREKTSAAQAAADQTAVLAQVIEEHAISTIRQVEDLTAALGIHIRRGMPLDTSNFVTDRSLVVSFGAYDSKGRLVLSSGLDVFPDISGADFFAAARSGRESRLFVGEPVRDRRMGWLLLPFSRRVVAADGTFMGVTVAMVDPDYFSSFYAFLGLPERSLVALARQDGTVLASQSLDGSTAGAGFGAAAEWGMLAAATGRYRGTSPTDGLDRFHAWRKIAQFPLLVVVGRSTEEVFAQWREHRGTVVSTAALLSFGLVLLTGALARQVLRRRSVDAALALHDRAMASSSDGIAIIERGTGRHRIIHCNAAFLRITGHSVGEALAADSTMLCGPYVDPGRIELEAALRDGREAAVEILNARRDGRPYWSEVDVAPVRDETGNVTHMVAVLRDVTERRQSEIMLVEAKEQAEAASRTKSEFLANMSHELRTPLNAILGFAEILEHGVFGPVNDKQREYLRDIHDSGSHLLQIISDILDISKIEAGRIELRDERVDATALVEACLTLIRPRAVAAQVRVETELPPGLPLLRGDEVRIKQVLLNLLSNAVKFTPAGGAVTVTATPHESGGVALAVADTGIGMSAEEIEEALKPFRQIDGSLSRRHEGTGLGLPLAKSLVELHGGRLRIDSRKGHGTTILAVFPEVEPSRSRLAETG